MNYRTRAARILSFVTVFNWLLICTGLVANSASSGNSTESRSRVPWTTSRIIGTPEPPSPYIVERAFPELKFTEPVELCAAPGSDRLFLAELRGKIFSFPNRPDVRQPDLFFDITNSIPEARSVYGLTFHPGFETNRYVFVCYVVKDGLPDGSRVSRFTVAVGEPPRIEPDSEQLIITWLSGGHNGGSLKFGADGFLYISTGDAAGPNPPDPKRTGQDNSDLLSAVLRIDVDRTEDGKPYAIPSDNPFAGIAGCRPEIWAYGFRNPWRMSFDRVTGDLWLGDVGWELWELVYRVERGGNYGWSIVEGPQSIHPDVPRGPTPILPPVKAHSHTEAASITGGFVYRGSRLPELAGAYVYGDWVTGKIWALRRNGALGASVQELVDTPFQIVAFGEDNSGEIYVVDYAGTFQRLTPNPAANRVSTFPHSLSETGLFESAKEHAVAPGVLPFSVNAEMWADNGVAQRFVGFPGASAIKTGATDVWIYQSKKEWRFPTNAVLAKTLSLELESGKPDTARRIETQLLHFDGLDWHAYSYRWNTEQTDAHLVSAEGADETFEIRDPMAPGGLRKQTWRFHSRSECLRCHNPWMNYALGFTALQLNRDVASRDGQPVENQLERLSELGFFDQSIDTRRLPNLVDPYSADGGAGLEQRARSWLHVNCAHCHREGAGGSVVTHFDFDKKTSDMKAIGREPSQGTFGLSGAHVVTAGDPYSSVLYYRILTTGQGRMPLIGSRHVDVAGANLMHDWIRELEGESLVASQSRDSAANASELLSRSKGADTKNQSAIFELLASTRGALQLISKLDRSGSKTELSAGIQDAVADHPSFAVRGLFERFLPDEKRSRKLGGSFPPQSVLSLIGNSERGRKIFFQEGAQCSQCHRIGDEGRDFGPDLSAIGKKYDRAQLLEHIIEPSKAIDQAYSNYVIEMQDGELHSGIIVSQGGDEVVLKDATSREVRLATGGIKSRSVQKLSAMPEGLLQNLTAEEAADLIEFLANRR